MEPRQQQFSLWYFVAASVVILAIQVFWLAPHVENLSYSDFKVLLRAGKMTDLALGPRGDQVLGAHSG